MPASIEERIVSMKIDNSSFLKGVQESIRSLGELNNALNLKGGSKGLEEVSAAAEATAPSLDELSQRIDQISNRFSTMGVIGTTAIGTVTSKITGGLMDALGSAFNQMMEGGKKRAQNLEHARFQFDALKLDSERAMEIANEAVTGTAYGLDEAAVAISSLAASGVDLETQMGSVLRGIAGTAAMTGDSFSSISDIFTTVASNGRLMTMQVRQLSMHGLNVAAILAEKMGKTEAEINEMVTKGQISFMDFANAMNDKFGESAQRANETFSGALSNFKASFSRIGAEFWTPFYTDMRDVLNAARPLVNRFKNALKFTDAEGNLVGFFPSMMNDIRNWVDFWIGFMNKLDSGGGAIESLGKLFNSAYLAATNLSRAIINLGIEPLLRSFNDTFGETNPIQFFVDALDKLNEAFLRFYDIMDNGWKGRFANESDKYYSFMKRLADGFWAVVAAISGLLGSGIMAALDIFSAGLQVLGFVLGVVGNVLDGLVVPIIQRLANEFDKATKTGQTQIALFSAILRHLGPVAEGFGMVVDAVADFIWALSLGEATLKDVVDFVAKIGDGFGKAWSGVVTVMGQLDNWFKLLRKNLETLGPIGQVLSFLVGILHSVVFGLWDVVHVIGDTWAKAWNTGLDPVRKFAIFAGRILESFFALLRDLGDETIPVEEAFGRFFERINDAFNDFVGAIVQSIPDLLGFLNGMLDELAQTGPIGFLVSTALRGVVVATQLLCGALGLLGSVAEAVGSYLGTKLQPVVEALGGVFGTFGETIDRVGSIFSDMQKAFGAHFGKLGSVFSDLTKDLSNGVSPAEAFAKAGKNLGTWWSEGLAIASQYLGSFIDVLSGVSGSAFEALTPLFDTIAPAADRLSEALAPLREGLGKGFSTFVDKVSSLGFTLEGASKFASEIGGHFKNFFKQLQNGRKPLEAFKELVSNLGSSFGHLGDKLGELGGLIAGTFGSIYDFLAPKLMPVIDTVSGALAPLFDILKQIWGLLEPVAITALASGLDLIIAGLDKLSQLVDGFLKDSFPGLSEFINSVKSFFQDLRGGLDTEGATDKIKSVQESFQGATDSINGFGDLVKNIFTGIQNAINNFFENFSKGNIIRVFEGTFIAGLAAGAAGLLYNFNMFMLEIRKPVKMAGGLIDEFKKNVIDIPKAFKDVLKSLGGMFADFGKAVKIEAVTSAILALTALFGVLYLLSTVDSMQLLKTAAIMAGLGIVLGIVAGALIKFVTGLAAVKNAADKAAAFQAAQLGILLIGLGVAIYGIANAIKTLSDVTLGPENIPAILAFLGSVIAVIAALTFMSTMLSKNPLKLSQFFVLIGIAGVLVAVGEAMSLIGDAMAKVQNVDIGKILAMGGIMTALLGLTVLAGAIGKAQTAYVRMSLALVVLAGAMYAMALVFERINKIKNLFDVKSITFLALMIAVIGAIGGLGAKFKAANFAAIGVGAVGMAVALGLLVGVFKEIKRLTDAANEGEMDKAIEAFAKLAIIMAGITLVAGIAAGFGGALGVLAAGGTLLAAAAGITALAFALSLLAAAGATGGLEQAVDAMAALALIGAFLTLVLTGVSVVLAGIAPLLLQGGAGFLMVGAGILLATAAIIAFGAAFSALPWVIETFAEDCINAFNKFISFIADKAPEIQENLQRYADVGGDDFVKSMGEHAASALEAFIEGFSPAATRLGTLGGEAAGAFGSGVLIGLGNAVDRIGTAGLILALKLITGLANGIREYSPLIQDAFGVVLSNLDYAWSSMGLEFAERTGQDWLADIFRESMNKAQVSIDEGNAKLDAALDEVAQTIQAKNEETSKAVAESNQGLEESTANHTDIMQSLMDSGYSKMVESITAKMEESTSAVDGGFSNMEMSAGAGVRGLLQKVSGIDLATPLGQSAAEASDSYSSNLDLETPTSNATASTLATMVAGMIKTISATLTQGKMVSAALGGGISSGSESVRSAVNSLSSIAKNANYSSGMHSNGTSISYGLANGIWDGMDSVRSAVHTLASLAARAVAIRNMIRSPSRVMMQLGEYISEGYAIGIENGLEGVRRVANNMAGIASDAVDGIKMNVDSMRYFDQMDLDVQPVVRPVFDGSNIVDGMNRIFGDTQTVAASWLGNGRFSDSLSNQASYKNNTYNITLDYNAGTDPNALVMALARAIEAKTSLEA